MTDTTAELETRMRVLELMEEYVQAVRDATAKYFADRLPNLQAPMTYAEPGRRFARIVQERANQRTVHAFVDLTNGDVIKAAGWKAPQKDKDGFAVRYRLADDEDRARCYSDIDPNGSYLYKR
jgi:hypothetical protein